jgi:hypothetical protein
MNRLSLNKASLWICLCTVNWGVCQTTNIGKVDNSGTCSFTAINVANSTYKITCGNKGLDPKEARQLSEVLSIVKDNRLQFDRVIEAVKNLKQENYNQPNCWGVYCNNGVVNAPQTYNNYQQFGASKPAPGVSVLKSELLPAIQRPVRTPEMSDADYQAALSKFQNQMSIDPLGYRPGVRLTVMAQSSFPNPAFIVKCSHSCQGTDLAIQQGNLTASETGAFSRNKIFRTDNPTVVIFMFGQEPMLVPGEAAILTLRSDTDQLLDSGQVEGYVQ